MHGRHSDTQACHHFIGRYPGWWNNLHRLPKRVFRTLSDHDESGAFRLVHLPLRGQRRLGVPLPVYTLLLPVELRCVNHTASTNDNHLNPRQRQTLQC